MTRIIENYSLKSLNTFGLDSRSAGYLKVENQSELRESIKLLSDKEFMVLGEGSNVLFLKDYPGIIIHPVLKGISILTENNLEVHIKAACGENWDKFVEHCVSSGWGGLENLSLIPGTVGSAPVQNIGAYGVEVKDRILWVEGIDIQSGEEKVLYNHECGFDYRQSIFKTELKGKFIITSVVFRLDKHHRFEVGYGHIQNLFNSAPEQNLSTLREIIIGIRRSKLPDPSEFGNAGSFFKNPVISPIEFDKIKESYPDVPSYPAGESIKIPAAWLIERAGWKGVREGDTGTWPGQPLVIVNYGNATGEEIYNFSLKLQKGVHDLFGIELEREVNLI